MPKFAANLTMLFNEVGFLERFDAAAKAGFTGVEYLFPYDFEAQELAELLKKNNLTQVLHNLPAGKWAEGERGIAVLPDRTDEFKEGVDKAIRYATTLGCKQVNILAGIAKDVDSKEAHSTFVANLKYAAPKLKEAGIRLLIEACNSRYDIPGFFLDNSRQAFAIMDEVASDNLFFQYDIYHMTIMEGDVSRTIEKNLARIAHIQLADNPGRNEPGTGEINFPFLFDHIDRIGYDGWIGCEYKPKGETAAGLGWLPK